MKTLDKIVNFVVCLGIFIIPVFIYAFLNVITRPDIIVVAIELPQPKPVIKIFEYRPEEEMVPLEGYWYKDKYEPYIANVNDTSYYPTKNEVICMAKNIYFESRTQSTKGQLAVGLVTLNRVKSPYFPNTVCGVVYQHSQFSWYWDGISDKPKNQDQWEISLLNASALLYGKIDDFTYGSDHYHADYVKPEWRLTMVKVTQIEQHIFYRGSRM